MVTTRWHSRLRSKLKKWTMPLQEWYWNVGAEHFTLLCRERDNWRYMAEANYDAYQRAQEELREMSQLKIEIVRLKKCIAVLERDKSPPTSVSPQEQRKCDWCGGKGEVRCTNPLCSCVTDWHTCARCNGAGKLSNMS